MISFLTKDNPEFGILVTLGGYIVTSVSMTLQDVVLYFNLAPLFDLIDKRFEERQKQYIPLGSVYILSFCP